MTISYGSSIITNNLGMLLDAANPRSYPGSGTAWNDISGNRNNGTLTNSPTYSANNNGYLIFNGTSQYVGLPYNATTLTFSATNFSLDCWIYLTAYSQGFSGYYSAALFSNYWLQWGISGTASSFSALNIYANGGTVNNAVSYSFALNTWYNLSMTYSTGTGTWTMYVNGNAIGSFVVATTWTEGNTNPYYIGNNPQTGYNYYFPGYISNFKAYNNITLSATQIGQNFTAYRGRYKI